MFGGSDFGLHEVTSPRGKGYGGKSSVCPLAFVILDQLPAADDCCLTGILAHLILFLPVLAKALRYTVVLIGDVEYIDLTPTITFTDFPALANEGFWVDMQHNVLTAAGTVPVDRSDIHISGYLIVSPDLRACRRARKWELQRCEKRLFVILVQLTADLWTFQGWNVMWKVRRDLGEMSALQMKVAENVDAHIGKCCSGVLKRLNGRV